MKAAQNRIQQIHLPLEDGAAALAANVGAT